MSVFPTPSASSCACQGQPCDCTPWLYTVEEPPREPLTLAVCDRLEEAGLYEIARIGRKYAVDRPRWWHRFTKRPTR
jgi:hypothetical protein